MSDGTPDIDVIDRELRTHLRARPFVPFEIVTAAGDHIHIAREHTMAMNEKLVCAPVPKRGMICVRKSEIVAVYVTERAARLARFRSKNPRCNQ